MGEEGDVVRSKERGEEGEEEEEDGGRGGGGGFGGIVIGSVEVCV